jgi:hypothetical protein
MPDERKDPGNGRAVGRADPLPPGNHGGGDAGGNGGVDDLLRELEDYCRARAEAHSKTLRYRTLRNTWLAIAAVVLSAILALPLLGTAAVNSTETAQEPAQEEPAAQGQDVAGDGALQPEAEEAGTAAIPLWIQWVAGIVALLSTVATGAQKVFNDTEKVGTAAKAAASYRNVGRDARIARARPTEQERWDAVTQIDTRLDEIEADLPEPFQTYLDRAEGAQRPAVLA